MKRKDIYKRLVRRYIENKASDTEREVFFHLLRKGKLEKYLDQEMAEDAGPFLKVEDKPAGKAILFRRRYIAAAIVIGLVSLGGLWWVMKKRGSDHLKIIAGKNYKNEIPPGGNKAILTLADGSTINLDSSVTGKLTKQGNTQVTKVDAGKLAYKASGSTTSAVFYNTVSTPAGGTYQVTLSDGTKVWLDSRSSIHFPTTFLGQHREVDITGQVYLEIAANARQPFLIKAKGQQVQVLGTSLNINAFDEEGNVTTTLAEGAVKVLEAGNTLLLKPGQGAQMDGKGNLGLIPHPDMEETLAWKEGLFHYNGTGITTIMNQIARWYDVEVIYKDKIPGSFVADIPRDVPVSKLLTLLELTRHVRFTIEGRKIIVMK